MLMGGAGAAIFGGGEAALKFLTQFLPRNAF